MARGTAAKLISQPIRTTHIALPSVLYTKSLLRRKRARLKLVRNKPNRYSHGTVSNGNACFAEEVYLHWLAARSARSDIAVIISDQGNIHRSPYADPVVLPVKIAPVIHSVKKYAYDPTQKNASQPQQIQMGDGCPCVFQFCIAERNLITAAMEAKMKRKLRIFLTLTEIPPLPSMRLRSIIKQAQIS